MRIWCFCLSLWLCSASVQALQKIRLMLDWLPNPDHAPLFVAQQQGIFAKHGLDVELIAPMDASDGAKLVAVGKMDVAITYQPSWLMQRAQGLDVAWLATLVDQPLACLISEDSIQRLSDLRHKTIGHSGGAVDSLVLKTMLQFHGVDFKDVSLLNIHYNLTQALLAHRVDAVSGAMRNVEWVELQQQGFTGHVFYPEQHGVPPYAELILVAKSQRVQEPALQALVAALKEAIALVKKQPEQSWQFFIRDRPELNTTINHRIWQVTMAYFTDRPEYFDTARNERLQAFLQVRPMA